MMAIYSMNRFSKLNPSNVKPIKEASASQKDYGWKYKIPLTSKALANTERKINHKLPNDLKKFVIATNAATPENYNFTVGDKEKVYGATLSFDCDSDNGDTVCSAYDAIGNSKVIPFGVDSFGNYICYVDKDGSIVFWDHETGKFFKVAKNLSDFISSLYRSDVAHEAANIKESRTSDYMTTGAYKVPDWILSLAKAFLNVKYINNERVGEYINDTIESYQEENSDSKVTVPFSFSDYIKLDGPVGEFDFYPLHEIESVALRTLLVPIITKLSDYIKNGLNGRKRKGSGNPFSVDIKVDGEKVKDIIHVEMNEDIVD